MILLFEKWKGDDTAAYITRKLKAATSSLSSLDARLGTWKFVHRMVPRFRRENLQLCIGRYDIEVIMICITPGSHATT